LLIECSCRTITVDDELFGNVFVATALAFSVKAFLCNLSPMHSCLISCFRLCSSEIWVDEDVVPNCRIVRRPQLSSIGYESLCLIDLAQCSQKRLNLIRPMISDTLQRYDIGLNFEFGTAQVGKERLFRPGRSRLQTRYYEA
jgi:hypothetical protein